MSLNLQPITSGFGIILSGHSQATFTFTSNENDHVRCNIRASHVALDRYRPLLLRERASVRLIISFNRLFTVRLQPPDQRSVLRIASSFQQLSFSDPTRLPAKQLASVTRSVLCCSGCKYSTLNYRRHLPTFQLFSHETSCRKIKTIRKPG